MINPRLNIHPSGITEDEFVDCVLELTSNLQCERSLLYLFNADLVMSVLTHES